MLESTVHLIARHCIMQAMQILVSRLAHAWLIDASQARPVGEIQRLIFDPEKLTVRYVAIDRTDHKEPLYVRADHIQWKSQMLLIRSINLVGTAEDFVRDQELLKVGGTPTGYKVIDESKQYIGQVHDISFSSQTCRVERLFIRPRWWQRIHHTDRIISRGSIRDILPDKQTIIIRDNRSKASSTAIEPMPA